MLAINVWMLAMTMFREYANRPCLGRSIEDVEVIAGPCGRRWLVVGATVTPDFVGAEHPQGLSCLPNYRGPGAVVRGHIRYLSNVTSPKAQGLDL